MPFFLKHRNQQLQEHMDDPNCEPEKLKNTYRHFKLINKLFSKWNILYKKNIRPFLEQNNGSATLLDIGFGGGDIPIYLSKLANKDGFRLDITAIETDKRSFDFAQNLNVPENINFKNKSSAEVLQQGKDFDFVISNHVVHHLDESTLQGMCKEAEQLATQKVIFNDLERSDIAYFLFFIFSKLLFWNSFVSVDGLISIKRSYTFEELSRLAPNGWKVYRVFPFRLILSYES